MRGYGAAACEGGAKSELWLEKYHHNSDGTVLAERLPMARWPHWASTRGLSRLRGG